ncbi:ankyrin repeat-containing domain protein [Trichoderma pleuroticola]
MSTIQVFSYIQPPKFHTSASINGTMRLLKTDTLETKEFDYGNIPQYAILSHRWGSEELTLQELEAGVTKKQGYKKVQQFCSRAKADGFDYGWVDTCCINKTSSAELSEAINSMYLWYYQAERCYAYLVDVPSKSTIEDSEWFARGWTLQELIAPSEVYFVDEHWNDLGTKKDLQRIVSKCTGIPINILSGDDDLETASIAQRMSWAANRKTQRLEDRAYSLMGIFGINMPLLYGEGERAFIRLQEEIMKVSDDHSLFAWESSDSRGGLLATSPEAFKDSKNIIPFNHFNDPNDASTVSSRGVHLGARFMGRGPRGLGLAILHCKQRGVEDRPIAIYVRDLFGTMQTFERVRSETLEQLDLRKLRSSQYPMRKLCVQTGRMTPTRRLKNLGKDGSTNQYDIYDNDTLEQLISLSDPAALLRAAESGSEDRVWLLLTRDDVMIDWMDEHKEYALLRAIDGGHENVVKILLARGANSGYIAGTFRTPLLFAVQRGHKSIVKLLLDNGAKIDFKDEKLVETPLLTAAEKGLDDIVELLLDKGADINSFDRPNDTPLRVASKAGHYGTVKLLLDNGARVDLTHYRYQHTPLQEAAAWGHESVVELLLDRGADIDSRDSRAQSPLYLASSSGHENIARLLFERGAEVDDKVQMPSSGHKTDNKVLQDKGSGDKPKEKKSGNFSINPFKKT